MSRLKQLKKLYPDVDEDRLEEVSKLEDKCEQSHEEEDELIQRLIDILHSKNGHLD